MPSGRLGTQNLVAGGPHAGLGWDGSTGTIADSTSAPTARRGGDDGEVEVESALTMVDVHGDTAFPVWATNAMSASESAPWRPKAQGPGREVVASSQCSNPPA